MTSSKGTGAWAFGRAEERLWGGDETPKSDQPANDPARVRAALRLYAVTDSTWLDGRALEGCVAQAISGGATFVQLREKSLSSAQLVEVGRPIKEVCAGAGVPFVVDDNVEAALALDADGVHVGQSDESCAVARAALGPNKIVGVSVSAVEEALAAQAAGADYLGVGAVFGTPTKPEAAVVSPQTLRSICHVVRIPCVAIGGLNARTLDVLRDTGVAGAAVVSALFAASDVEQAARVLRARCDEVCV